MKKVEPNFGSIFSPKARTLQVSAKGRFSDLKSRNGGKFSAKAEIDRPKGPKQDQIVPLVRKLATKSPTRPFSRFQEPRYVGPKGRK